MESLVNYESDSDFIELYMEQFSGKLIWEALIKFSVEGNYWIVTEITHNTYCFC